MVRLHCFRLEEEGAGEMALQVEVLASCQPPVPATGWKKRTDHPELRSDLHVCLMACVPTYIRKHMSQKIKNQTNPHIKG